MVFPGSPLPPSIWQRKTCLRVFFSFFRVWGGVNMTIHGEQDLDDFPGPRDGDPLCKNGRG